MNEVSRLVRRLQVAFGVALMLPVLYAVLSFAGVIDLTFTIANADVSYACDVAGVLVTLVVVPLSLKYFNKFFTSKVLAEAHLAKAMRRYYILCLVRLGALFLASAYNVLLYFSECQENNAGMLCFCICLLAFAFCVPTETRVKGDLNLDE